jgi:hypothetical protein
LTVTAARLVSIAVTPANSSIAKGLKQQFTATGTYTDSSTQDLTTRVTWASVHTAVATISNASGSMGLATAVGTGRSKITARLSGIRGSTVLTVTSAAPVSIAATPANPVVARGLTERVNPTDRYTDRSTQNLVQLMNWASATPSMATAVAQGTSAISTKIDEVTSPADFLTVNQTPVSVAQPRREPPPTSVTTATTPVVTLIPIQSVLDRKHRVTQIVLSLIGALDDSWAQDLVTDRRATADKHGSFTAKNAKAVDVFLRR